MTEKGFRDPYSSQNRRAAEIAERYAATHTPETLPEHLKPAMEAAEVHFAQTAPGNRAGTATIEVEAPPYDAPVPPEMYFDPTTGEEHVIDQARTHEQAVIDQARREVRRIVGTTTAPRGDTAAVGHGKTLGHLIKTRQYPNN